MNIAVCFLSRNKNHFNLKTVKELALSSKHHNVDVYEYVDDDLFEYKYNSTEGTIYCSLYYIAKKYNWNCIHSGILGNKSSLMFLPLIDLYSMYKSKYDMYLFWEDDTSYFGNTNIFDTIDFNCDVIFLDERLIIDNNWHWWKSGIRNALNTRIDTNIIKKLYHGLLNIYSMTPSVIENFMLFIETNWAFYEMLIPSYILNNEYKVHYINDYIASWLSWEDKAPITNNYDLIHPIKNIEKYNLIKAKVDKRIDFTLEIVLPFEKIYCLNISKSFNRKKAMNQMFKRNNIKNNIIYTEYTDLDFLKNCNSIYTAFKDIFNSKIRQQTNSVNYIINSLSCLVNHYLIIKYNYDAGVNSICVFEDDVYITDNALLKQYIENIPKDWDVIRYGVSDWFDFSTDSNLYNKKDNILFSDNSFISGTLCYAMNRKGMKAFIDCINNTLYFADSIITWLKDVNVYYTKDKLVLSNITFETLINN